MLVDVTNNMEENGKQLILQALEDRGKPMTTKGISTHRFVKGRLKWASVRVYVRHLCLEKKVRQLYARGPYVITTRYGAERGLKLHNIRLQLEGVSFARKVEDFDRWFGNIHVYITFGVRHGKISCSIAKDRGLEWSEWNFVQALFLWKCEEVLGHSVDLAAIRVLQAEIGNDHLRRRLEGVAKCVTLTDANGVLERIYQKDDSTVRREVKVKNTTIEALEALWKGGVASYSIL